MKRSDSESTSVREEGRDGEDENGRRGGGEGEGVHLIVLIHGLYGNPSNLAVVKEELERASSIAKSESEPGSSSQGHRRRGTQQGTSANYDGTDQHEIDSNSNSDDNSDTGNPQNGEEEEVDNLLEPTSRYTGRKIIPSRILVLKSFEGSHTWDGIDINAQRAAKEVSRGLDNWARGAVVD